MPPRNAARSLRQPPARLGWIHSTRLHVVLYSLLLIATPFLMLRRFLQSAIGRTSNLSFSLAGLQVPAVPVVAVVVLILLLIALRRHITRMRIVAGVVVVLMIALAQQVTDYYFSHNFYDLQQNWHYIAYALFAFMMHRDLAPRGVRLSRIMLVTYCAALLFSTLDEAFQLHVSLRVFDVSDIAKDLWGALAGMTFLYLGGTRAGTLLSDWRPLRQPRLRDYLSRPASLHVLMTVFAFLLLFFSSLLSDFCHWKLNILFPLATFAVFLLCFHLSQRRWAAYTLLTLLAVAVGGQAWAFVKYRHENIVYNRYGLTIYKGIPIVFFDVLIFPDSTFRLVDRKHQFNVRDQAFLLRLRTDIILIGSGADGQGGRGFYRHSVNQFVWNPNTRRGTQIIILKTPEACQVFNRLKRQGKNVLFILHNTC